MYDRMIGAGRTQSAQGRIEDVGSGACVSCCCREGGMTSSVGTRERMDDWILRRIDRRVRSNECDCDRENGIKGVTE